MSFDRVPQELTDYILDFVQDNRPTLHSCLRVSRSFAEASRYHLFRDIDIHGQGESLSVQSRLNKLHRLIQSPRSAKHIRRLSIWSYPSPDQSRNTAAFIPIPFDVLEAILTQLPSLQRLELKYVHIIGSQHAYSCYPSPPSSPLASSFSLPLQSLEMEAVAMDHMDTMLPVLLSLAQPSKLYASVVIPAKQDTTKARPPVQSLMQTYTVVTKSLRLSRVSDEFVQSLLSTLSNDHVRTLIIEGPLGPARSVELIGELFQCFSSSLEELELSEYMFRGSVQWGILPLEALQQLKHVTIHLILDSSPLEFSKTWRAVAMFLHRVPKTVTSIKFVTELSDVPECLPRPLLPPAMLNPCFDRFPALHTVAFGWTLLHYPTRPQRTEELTNLIRQLYPDLQRKGLLRFVPETIPRHFMYYKW